MRGFDIDLDALSGEEKQLVTKLLQENEDVFSKDQHDLGFTRTVQHEIPLVDPTPFRQPYRRIPPAEFHEVKSHIEELEKSSVIQPSQSPFALPIVVVRKKDGKI